MGWTAREKGKVGGRVGSNKCREGNVAKLNSPMQVLHVLKTLMQTWWDQRRALGLEFHNGPTQVQSLT